MWLRHGVDEWHLECRREDDKHDFIASISRRGSTWELYLPPSGEGRGLRKEFDDVDALNRYLELIRLEQLTISNPS